MWFLSFSLVQIYTESYISNLYNEHVMSGYQTPTDKISLVVKTNINEYRGLSSSHGTLYKKQKIRISAAFAKTRPIIAVDTYILILYNLVGRFGHSIAALHLGNKLVHSNGSGKDRNRSLNSAAVTNTGTFSRHTSSQTSIFSRSSRTSLAFADFLNIPWVNGPLENIWRNIAC